MIMVGQRLLMAAMLLLLLLAASVKAKQVYYLEAGSIVDYTPRSRGFLGVEEELRTFCYIGSEETLARVFESIELQLVIEGDDYTQYEGATPAEVEEHYDEKRSLFSLSLFSQKRTRLQLSPFQQQCIGIKTATAYQIRLQLTRIDFWRVIQLTTGVLMFFYAGLLSHNPIFFYITGVAVGICSSFMLLIWLSSKLVPRRPMMYSMLIGGWAIGLYVVRILWENLQLIVITYRTYVFWYILITGVISFFFCYRWGPPQNQRSKNIIKWSLQFVSLFIIYHSSVYEDAMACIIIIAMVIYYFPSVLLYRARSWYLRYFPPKRRLLTVDEFYEQGVKETTKALGELRTYCRSPECNQWKVMVKLRDPIRFAHFIDGDSHLRAEEVLYSETFGDENETSGGETTDEETQPQNSSNRNSYRMKQRNEEEMSGEEYDDDDSVLNVANNIHSSPPYNGSHSRAVYLARYSPAPRSSIRPFAGS